MRRYLVLMHELAIRLNLIVEACDGELNLTPPYAREYIYFQFRRVCELIALGCLELHGYLPQAKKKSMQKEWNAEKIINALHREHPHSFPQCVSIEKTSDKRSTIRANSNPEALTREEFKKLYFECGDVLHRGNIRSLGEKGNITQADFAKTMYWQKKIVYLMNQHIIVKENDTSYYYCALRSSSGYPKGEIHKFDTSKNEMMIEEFNIKK